MGIFDTQQGATATAEPEVEEEVSTFDFDNAVVEVEDPTADVNIPPVPPPAGTYSILWKLQTSKGKRSGFDRLLTQTGETKPYLKMYLQGSVQAEDKDYHEFGVYTTVNTLTGRNKPTSGFHHFLNLVGAPTSKSAKFPELEDHARQVLESAPLGFAELQWSVSIKDPSNPKANKDGWLTLAGRMEDFPKNYLRNDKGEFVDRNGNVVSENKKVWDGTYQYWIENPKNGDKLYAQIQVLHFVAQP